MSIKYKGVLYDEGTTSYHTEINDDALVIYDIGKEPIYKYIDLPLIYDKDVVLFYIEIPRPRIKDTTFILSPVDPTIPLQIKIVAELDISKDNKFNQELYLDPFADKYYNNTSKNCIKEKFIKDLTKYIINPIYKEKYEKENMQLIN